MSLLTILEFPDPRLRTVAKPVTDVDDRVQTLISDMLEAMYDAPGIGLAATQVNVHQRIVVMDLSEDASTPQVLINPEIEVLDDFCWLTLSDIKKLLSLDNIVNMFLSM